MDEDVELPSIPEHLCNLPFPIGLAADIQLDSPNRMVV